VELIFQVITAAAFAATVFGNVLLVTLLVYFLGRWSYQRMTTGRWWWNDPDFETVDEQKRYYGDVVANSVDATKSAGIVGWVTYLTPVVFYVHALPEAFIPKINTVGVFFYLALLNAVCLNFVRQRHRERFERYTEMLRQITEEEVAADTQRREEAQQQARAERQAQKDREYAQHRERAEQQSERAERQAQKEREYARQREREREEARRRKQEEDASKEQRRSSGQGQRQSRPPHRPWHEVLGVAASASQDEIRKAYIQLLKQYHPDKVFDLGEDLKNLATKKTAEINQAYAEATAGQ
jgi:DnaJ-domain-containing protein 1